MAFSDDDKYRIIRLLGWPANTLNPNSLSYQNIIASRLLYIPEQAEGDVLDLVDRINSLDTELRAAVSSAGIKKIDDIEFFGEMDGSKTKELRAERRRLLIELASTLDIALGPGASGGGGIMGNIRL